MKSYIHLYKKNSEFTAAYNGPDYVEPWLSLTEENMSISYNKPKLTAITFDNITWVTDVPSTGGTATKENCKFKVYAKYDNGISVDILSDATVTGELVVEPSTADTRQSAGTLTLTAKYSGFTATGNVTAYQAAAAPDFSTEPLTFNILSDGTVNWTASNSSLTKTIDYNLNDSNNWTSITSNTGESAPTITVKAGEKIQFRGDNAQYCGDNPGLYSTFGGSTAEFEIEGNIMSLINSTDFSTATTLESGFTFAFLFSNCTGLTSAENLILPATPLAMGCYFQMFQGCTSLTTAPELPVTDLAMGCYAGMFIGCKKLTTAPKLPARALADVCYNSMFQGCTSLTTAPELPANTLAMGCYAGMFIGCTKLTTATELPARALADACYNSMFQGCTSLNYIKCLATDISASNCTSNWVDGVAATGTFVKSPGMSGWIESIDGVPTGWTVEDNQEPLTFNILSAGTINWTASNTDIAKTIDYKLNDNEWASITSNTGSSAPSIEVNSGDKIQFRGNNSQYASGTSIYNLSYNLFGGSALFEAEGNIMSLIYGDDFKNKLTISDNAFAWLFSECVNLVSAENLILPATTLANYCYCYMFWNCTSLTTAPALPATTLADNCYNSMFNGCKSLTTAPEIPATTLASFCCYQMFYDCTSLTTAPKELPATTLADDCYENMFRGCTSLTTAPKLPATTLASFCYSSMFDYCISLTTAPELPATTLAERCYQSMFRNCTSLNYIKCLATDISASNCTMDWVDGVASTGTFFKASSMNDWKSGTSGIPEGWAVEEPVDYTKEPLTFNILSAGTINWTASNTDITKTIDYKLNDGGWTPITSNKGSSAPSIEVNSGDKLQFRGNNTQYATGTSAYNSFNGSTALFESEGNIMSLIYGDDFKNKLTISNNYAFAGLFKNCTKLVSAKNLVLPATTLADSCYADMFYGCTSLTTAPSVLPATTLASSCCSSMFQGCTKLITAPALPATDLAESCYIEMFYDCTSLTTVPSNLLPATTLTSTCYQSMFRGCSSLTVAPELPATTLADSCYLQMFYDCTSLTTASKLPATTLASNCYGSMFNGCKSLTTAPELPATTLAIACYSNMFQGCTKLTTSPKLPATTLANGCYSMMFKGCTSLTTAPALPATTLADYCYDSMFIGCTSLTTAPALPATTLGRNCYSTMFSGCRSLTTAPALPATTLALFCYNTMFSGCRSLTTAPELPATTLAKGCYDSMFYKCTKLNYIKCLATNISATNCTSNWVSGVASTGTFVKAAGMTSWPTGTSGIPTNWTVQDA